MLFPRAEYLIGPVEENYAGHHEFWGNDSVSLLVEFLVTTLAWPVVIIIIAVLVYLVIRKAIASGNTVEISWKVTEKARGRIVLRKVVERRRT